MIQSNFWDSGTSNAPTASWGLPRRRSRWESLKRWRFANFLKLCIMKWRWCHGAPLSWVNGDPATQSPSSWHVLVLPLRVSGRWSCGPERCSRHNSLPVTTHILHILHILHSFAATRLHVMLRPRNPSRPLSLHLPSPCPCLKQCWWLEMNHPEQFGRLSCYSVVRVSTRPFTELFTISRWCVKNSKSLQHDILPDRCFQPVQEKNEHTHTHIYIYIYYIYIYIYYIYTIYIYLLYIYIYTYWSYIYIHIYHIYIYT